MTTVQEVYDRIDSFAPFSAQEEWDNSGLLVGTGDAPVHKLGVVLDITLEAVRFAAKNGFDLLVSHHPVIFHPLNRLEPEQPACLLMRHGISAICAHTSLDCARGGVNDALANALGLQDVRPFPADDPRAMVRIGSLPEQRPEDFAMTVARRLGADVRYLSAGRPVSRIALCSGAGAAFLSLLPQGSIDAFLTGDAGHHDFLDAAQIGITLVAAGHYETEQEIVPVLADRLQSALPGLSVSVIPQARPIVIVTCQEGI